MQWDLNPLLFLFKKEECISVLFLKLAPSGALDSIYPSHFRILLWQLCSLFYIIKLSLSTCVFSLASNMVYYFLKVFLHLLYDLSSLGTNQVSALVPDYPLEELSPPTPYSPVSKSSLNAEQPDLLPHHPTRTAEIHVADCPLCSWCSPVL